MSSNVEPRDILDRVVVVLVRARNPNNIGAAARAMHNFGFRHLRVVNDYLVPFETARSAVDADEVLKMARICGTLAEAVCDCNLVVGTTAIGERVLQHPVHVLPEAAKEIMRHLAMQNDAAGGRVGLLFGSEKTGLSNEELSYCHWLLTIPMRQHEGVRHASMNLGQSVAVCLYEIAQRCGLEDDVAAKTDMPAAASAAEVERLCTLLNEVLEKTEYKRRHPANCSEEEIRRLVLRMNVSGADASIWMGILRQLLWRISQP